MEGVNPAVRWMRSRVEARSGRSMLVASAGCPDAAAIGFAVFTHPD